MMLFAAPCPLFGSVENLLPFTPANSNKSRIILASVAAIDVAFTLTTTQIPVHSRHVDSPLGGAIGVAKPVESAVDSNCPYRSASGLPTTESNETVTGRVPENRCRVSATSVSLSALGNSLQAAVAWRTCTSRKASARCASAAIAVSVADFILASNESASLRADAAEDTADAAASLACVADCLASPACVTASVACWRTKSRRELFRVLNLAFELDDRMPMPSSPTMPATTRMMLATSTARSHGDGLSGGLTKPLPQASLSSRYWFTTKYTSRATPIITASDESQSHFSKLSTYCSMPDICDSIVASALSRAERSMTRYQHTQMACFIAMSILLMFVVTFGMGTVLYYWIQDQHIDNHATRSTRVSDSHAATRSFTSHSRSVIPAAIAGLVRRVRCTLMKL